MNQLEGNITLSKRLAGHKVWKREPMCAGAAWVDLLMLANDKPADIFLHGEAVHLERGQLGWSIFNLAERWRRSREWTTKYLRDLQDDGQIILDASRRKTVITVCNYEAFQTTEPTSEEATEPTTVPATAPTQKLETGIGKGNSDPPPAEIPSDDVVGEFCACFKDLARGIEGIPETWWSGWLAYCVSGSRPFPRDWIRALVLAHRSDWLNPHSPGHAKARFNISAQAQNPAGEKKPRRERGEILQELSIEQFRAKRRGGNEAAIAALQEELKNAR